MPRADRPPVRRSVDWPIKDALLILYLATGGTQIADRAQSLGAAGLILYLYLCLFAGLALALWLTSRIALGGVRWTLALLLFASAAFMAANERITGQHFSYESFLNMLAAAAFVGDAIAQHGARMAVAGARCRCCWRSDCARAGRDWGGR